MDLAWVDALEPAAGASWRDGDAFLAGGSWLFSEPQPSVRRLLDLESFGWEPIVEREDGVELSATCTMATLARWSLPPVFRQCCDALLGSFKIWNAATVGGNICLALPAGPMTSLTAALDGVAELWSADGSVRTLPVRDLVLGSRRTALGPGELMRSVLLPWSAVRARHAFRQLSLSAYGRSAALVIGRVDALGETVVTVTASTPRPVVLRWESLPPVEVAVAEMVTAVNGDWHDDVHGAPAWRAAMTERLVAEVLAELGAAS